MKLRNAIPVVLATLAIPVAMAVPAVAMVPPPYTCPGNGLCTFENDNWTGSPLFLPNSSIGAGNVFNFIDNSLGHADSVTNHTGGDLWIVDRQLNSYVCIIPAERYDSNDTYGYGEFLTAGNSHNCTENIPGNL